MMQESVSVKKGTFASPLLPVITVLFALTALVGAAAVVSLFHSASIPAILADMETAQINDPNARQSWLIIYIVVSLCFWDFCRFLPDGTTGAWISCTTAQKSFCYW